MALAVACSCCRSCLPGAPGPSPLGTWVSTSHTSLGPTTTLGALPFGVLCQRVGYRAPLDRSPPPTQTCHFDRSRMASSFCAVEKPLYWLSSTHLKFVILSEAQRSRRTCHTSNLSTPLIPFNQQPRFGCCSCCCLSPAAKPRVPCEPRVCSFPELLQPLKARPILPPRVP